MVIPVVTAPIKTKFISDAVRVNLNSKTFVGDIKNRIVATVMVTSQLFSPIGRELFLHTIIPSLPAPSSVGSPGPGLTAG